MNALIQSRAEQSRAEQSRTIIHLNTEAKQSLSGRLAGRLAGQRSYTNAASSFIHDIILSLVLLSPSSSLSCMVTSFRCQLGGVVWDREEGGQGKRGREKS